ncbi:lipid scramblase CLPTM1L-like [Oppia nitens]|uniref:lipid scramblase CLPTM1L-like n=1 Tax=Oppia nitens TaxID=1686743 RepID=UPI0023DBFEFA|nr:lipid scramblase CLPTM1L-like [Oppia nitens]XP_054165447.1 lipid scramblase CLPTM1L-like [Oppia nitens]XP_054165448.1 lipid scramblase CLPTM1L-like [Oppia nitens]
MTTMFPSFSWIITTLFTVYILHSMHTIYKLYNPEECNPKTDHCLDPSYTRNDIFTIFLCTSLDEHPLAKDMTCIHQNNDFSLIKEQKLSLSVSLPAQTLRNGSLYLHAVLTPLKRDKLSREIILHRSTSTATITVTKYAIKESETFNLLNAPKIQSKVSERKGKTRDNRVVTHWKPKITLNIISEPISLSRRALPGEITHLLKLNERTQYLPILYISELRQRVKDLWPVNSSHPVLPLEVVYEPTAIGKLRFMLIIESSLNSMHKMGFTESDSDDIKGIFFDTNIYLLLLTIFITSFHVLFDFLAFKNDIQFWRQRKSMEGLSFSSLLWRCVSQFVITLYLMENKTSYLVLIPSAIGTVIELWKLKKALKIEIKGFKVFFKSRTEAELKTDSYDSTFMKYLSIYVLTPLVIGGAIYSIVYTQHKSWYSWLIQSAANGVYAFGFLFMLPQLFINYKMKSVAHLPWKAFMYKAFNTFIDDLFAFLITSIPTAHRVAAFRDDVVFIIYLYQRWLYPVDKNRVNEYGETTEEKKTK